MTTLAQTVQALSIAFFNALPASRPIIAADDARIEISDYSTAVRSVERIAFTRAYSGASNGNQHMNPGARVRFQTNSAKVTFRYDHTNLNTRSDAFNGVISFMVDGGEEDTATVVYGSSGEATKSIDMGSAAWRTWEMIMPYGASVDFLAVQIERGSSFQAAEPRPTKKLLVNGDSITHGFLASKTIKSWPYLLGEALGCQVINEGYGGAQINLAQISAAAALDHDAATYLIGYNDFYAQTALETFSSRYQTALEDYRNTAGGKPLWAITMTWTGHTDTIEPGDYRDTEHSVLAALNDDLTTEIDGLALADNDTGAFSSDPHPGDAGSAQIAANLAGIVVI